jgi:hypothetical protein
MPGRHKCPCGADLPTLRGLRSHQSQSRECRAWATRAKVASGFEDEASEGPSHSEPTPPVEPMQPSDDEYETDNSPGPLPPDPLVIHDSDEETIPTPSSSKKRHYVESSDEEEDEQPHADFVYIQEFPAHFRAGWKKGEFQTQFEILRERQKAEGQEPWFPFPSEDEWELARWLMESAASQSKIDSFMKLKAVYTYFESDIPIPTNHYPKDPRRSTSLQKCSWILQIHRFTASRAEILLYPSKSDGRHQGRQW